MEEGAQSRHKRAAADEATQPPLRHSVGYLRGCRGARRKAGWTGVGAWESATRLQGRAAWEVPKDVSHEKRAEGSEVAEMETLPKKRGSATRVVVESITPPALEATQGTRTQTNTRTHRQAHAPCSASRRRCAQTHTHDKEKKTSRKTRDPRGSPRQGVTIEIQEDLYNRTRTQTHTHTDTAGETETRVGRSN